MVELGRIFITRENWETEKIRIAKISKGSRVLHIEINILKKRLSIYSQI